LTAGPNIVKTFMAVIYLAAPISGLYYNPVRIVNDDARVVNKLETHLLTPLESSFTIVTCFIIQATGALL